MLCVAFYSIVAFYVLLAIRDTIRCLLSGRWISKPSRAKWDGADRRLYVLVPMYLEQSIAKNTVYRFYNLIKDRNELEVVFITTEKERASTDRTTREVIEDVFCEIGTPRHMRIIHYPYSSGVMAHQLNYAIKVIKEEQDVDFWISVYNADSIIDSKTVDELLCLTSTSKDKRECFQQYALYQPESRMASRLAQGAAMWQNRWTVCYELYRCLSSQYFRSKGIVFPFGKMNYVIGHGLTIRLSLLEKVGLFPENEINEDACLGYRIAIYGGTVNPVKQIEYASSPVSGKVYLKQQMTWFNGPSRAFGYYEKAIAENARLRRHRFTCFVMAVKMFSCAVYWLCSPAVLLLGCPLLCRSIREFIVWSVVVVFYLFGVDAVVSKICEKVSDGQIGGSFALVVGSIESYALHGFGAVSNVVSTMFGKNTMDSKYKTERQADYGR